MTDWQPIETAPKDGTQIVLYFPTLRYGARVGRYYRSETFEHGKLDRSSEGWSAGLTFGGSDAHPTHWMPLPTAPQPIAESAA